jgi:hypothetical protein
VDWNNLNITTTEKLLLTQLQTYTSVKAGDIALICRKMYQEMAAQASFVIFSGILDIMSSDFQISSPFHEIR